MYRIQLKNIKKTRNHEAMAKTKKLTQKKKRINKSKAEIYECCVRKKVTSCPLPMVFFFNFFLEHVKKSQFVV